MGGYSSIEQDGHAPIKAWTHGVPIEDAALQQLKNVASLPFIHRHVAVMPSVHRGRGVAVGSVIPTVRAIIPAAVGVDIGCGIMAVRTSIRAEHLPDDLSGIRSAIEAAVPHGRTDKGAWADEPPEPARIRWEALKEAYSDIVTQNPRAEYRRAYSHLGTLGDGNHFIELCLDEAGDLWVMLHSGSRGAGHLIGSHFIARAKRVARRWFINLPDEDLAYFIEDAEGFHDYVRAVSWAQKFARANREVMMCQVLGVLHAHWPDLKTTAEAVNCHHNYVRREKHFGQDVWLTRRGAVSAKKGELGIIPGSMGARSFIVRGKGNADSFCSCSHGAGRAMSRDEANRRFTVEDHVRATQGVECRKDAEMIDETPLAYKDIDAVIAAQSDLIEVVHTLRQVVCIKG